MSDLGVAVQQVSEKVSVLVREEIELAKAEVTVKAKTLDAAASRRSSALCSGSSG